MHLWELDVVREAQGQGVGRALIATAADEARRQGRPALTLTTFASIAWNAPFYERVGFRRISGPDLGARLAAVLSREAERGLTDRCAMSLPI